MAGILAQEPDIAAVALLGAVVRSDVDGITVRIRLNEVEAYGGSADPASHAFRTRSRRNEPMWGPAGTLYVYLAYGIHWCANIVTGPEGKAGAVLMRGGTVIEGVEAAERRRGRRANLADGPGKLGQALGLTGEVSGSDIWEGPLTLEGPLGSVPSWESTPRIGVSRATDRPWRFTPAT